MCHYTHLTPFEREKILFFLAEGKSITEIAHLLKRSKSTISREFRRNAAPVDLLPIDCASALQAAQESLIRISGWSMHHCIPTSRSVSWSTTGRQRRLSDGSRRITSNGNTMSCTCALGSALATKHHMRSISQRCCT